MASIEQWIRQINNQTVYLGKFHPYVDYREAQAFLDFCIDLMSKNKENASILYYGKKVLSKHRLTPNASMYLTQTLTSLSLLYPYIVPLLDKYVYTTYGVDQEIIKSYVNLIYEKYLSKDYFEAVSFALYFSTKYDVTIDNFDVDAITSKNDCIMSLCALIYCRHHNLRRLSAKMKEYAKELKKDDNDFISQWPFAYECLTVGLVTETWKEMKKDNVSFLKSEYR